MILESQWENYVRDILVDECNGQNSHLLKAASELIKQSISVHQFFREMYEDDPETSKRLDGQQCSVMN